MLQSTAYYYQTSVGVSGGKTDANRRWLKDGPVVVSLTKRIGFILCECLGFELFVFVVPLLYLVQVCDSARKIQNAVLDLVLTHGYVYY